MFCRDAQNATLEGLRGHIEIVHELAEEFDAVLFGLQSDVDKEILRVPAERRSCDSVPRYLWAHAWIAQRRLEAAGL